MSVQDLNLNNVSLRTQFVQFFQDGDYASAFGVLDNNPSLLDQEVIASVFNAISTQLTADENLYDTDVTKYMATLLALFQSYINQTKKIGAYSPAVQYLLNNYVIYNNLVYMCSAKPPIGTLPTNPAYWRLVDIRGAKGSSGLGVTLKGEWSVIETYSAKDVVAYGNTFYVANATTTGQVPSPTSPVWKKFLTLTRATITTNTTPPPASELVAGKMWFKLF